MVVDQVEMNQNHVMSLVIHSAVVDEVEMNQYPFGDLVVVVDRLEMNQNHVMSLVTLVTLTALVMTLVMSLGLLALMKSPPNGQDAHTDVHSCPGKWRRLRSGSRSTV